MTLDLLIRVVSLCVLLAGMETLHGIARTVWLVRLVGKARAIRWSVVSGSALAFGVCWVAVPGIGLEGLGPHLLLGGTIALFMAGFDLFIGRALMRLPWPKILRDFNPRYGNFLSVGLLLLSTMPATVWWLRAG